jgi:hypothetical protein
VAVGVAGAVTMAAHCARQSPGSQASCWDGYPTACTVDAEVLEPLWHLSEEQGDDPAEQGDDVEPDLEQVGEDQGGDREQQPEEDRQPALVVGGGDLDVDRVGSAAYRRAAARQR